MVTRVKAECTQKCPIESTLSYIRPKWTLEILRDIFFGHHRFSEFLSLNKELSSKVLAQRLKDLELNKLIVKKVISSTPMVVEYHLTAKGLDLNKIVYEIAQFGYAHDKIGTAGTCPVEVKKTLRIKV